MSTVTMRGEVSRADAEREALAQFPKPTKAFLELLTADWVESNKSEIARTVCGVAMDYEKTSLSKMRLDAAKFVKEQWKTHALRQWETCHNAIWDFHRGAYIITT